MAVWTKRDGNWVVRGKVREFLGADTHLRFKTREGKEVSYRILHIEHVPYSQGRGLDAEVVVTVEMPAKAEGASEEAAKTPGSPS